MKRKPVYNYRAYLGYKSWQKTLIVFAVFTFIYLSLDIRVPIWDIFTASTVFFSIIFGFFLSSALSNLSRLKTLVASECGILIAFHDFISIVNRELKEEVANLIDKYIIARFDWELENYVENTEKEFSDIFDVLESKKIDPKNDRTKSAINYCFNSEISLSQIRQEISIVSKSALNNFYWTLLVLLGGIVILTLFLSIEKTVTGKITGILLSTAIAVAFLILDDVDRNKINEHIMAFETYNRVLTAIGKLPCYLQIDIKAKRVKPPKDKPYRLIVYKDFPYSFEKEILVVNPKV